MSNLLKFIAVSTSAFHATLEAKKVLKKSGFKELDEKEDFHLKNGGKYFIEKDSSALLAFIVPQKTIKSASILISHTDSPSFRLKPKGEHYHENMVLWSLETYGGPIYSSWMNRDLMVSGRIFTEQNKKLTEHLITLEEHPVTLSQLPIHIDRKVNTEGQKISAQEHLNAIATLSNSSSNKKSYLESLLKKKVKFSKLVHHELYLSPMEQPRFLGENKNLMAAPRIDNLCSVYASLEAMKSVETAHSNKLMMIYCANNEEIGSRSFSGADSPFFENCLKRICYQFDDSFESFQKCLANSFAISLDGVHALDPNYKDKFEPNHTPLLGKGVTVKIDATGSYAFSSAILARVKQLAEKHQIKIQFYLKRGDVRQGSTIGPLFVKNLGIDTLDLGISQLSMHSIREIASCRDYQELAKLLKLIFKKY